MKTLTLLSFFFIVASSFSCKKSTEVNATVVKDCTGIYLRVNTSDYRVCNTTKLQNYDNGEEVNASFKIAGEGSCKAKDVIACMMLHEFKDWIIVTKVD